MNNAGEKTNIKEVGLNSIENDVVKNNLMGKSRYMNKKGWVDAQGRKVRARAWCLPPAPCGPPAPVWREDVMRLGPQKKRVFLKPRRLAPRSDRRARGMVFTSLPTSTGPTSMATHRSTPPTAG